MVLRRVVVVVILALGLVSPAVARASADVFDGPATPDLRTWKTSAGGVSSAQAGTRKVPLAASIVVHQTEADQDGRCSAAAYLTISEVRDAVSYAIDIEDFGGGSPPRQTITAPPFNDDMSYVGKTPPKGTHVWPLSGFSGRGCGEGWNLSRWKIHSAFAFLKSTGHRIVGSVTDKAGQPLGGTRISVSGATSASTKTKADGSYEVKVKKGKHQVSAPEGLCVVGVAKCTNSRTVSVNGTAEMNFVHRGFSISGKLTPACDKSASCKALQGVEVAAVSADDFGRAVSDKRGEYTIEGLPKGSYVVAPQLTGSQVADPEQRSVTLKDKDATKQNFSICGRPLKASQSGGKQPCRRTYTFELRSWLPYGSVADPVTGPDTQEGTDRPNHSREMFGTSYPPCVNEGVRQGWDNGGLEVMWASRFLGHQHAGFDGSGLGNVTVPIVYDGATGRFDIRLPSVKAGQLTRRYDFDRPPNSCDVPRAVQPVVGVYERGAGFEIHVTWPNPFVPFETAADIKDFADTTIKPLTTAAKKKFEEQLEKIPGYAKLPDDLKDKVKEYGEKLANKVGAAFAVDIVKRVLKEAKGAEDALRRLTPPVINYGKRALAILKKLVYPAGDMRIKGNFDDKVRGGLVLNLDIVSDGFPSYGFRLTRTGMGEVPWTGSQSVQYVGPTLPPNVVNDSVTETGSEGSLQGGPAVKGPAGLLYSRLTVLNNATPPGLQAFFAPNIFAVDENSVRPVKMSYKFLGSPS